MRAAAAPGAWLRAAWRVLGRRGTFLILLGAYDLFYGWYLAAGGPLGHALFLPERAWGWAWIGTGIALIAGGTRQRDGLFFGLAVLMKTVWAMEYYRAWLLGQPLQWVRGCFFLALALIVVLISSWPEADG